MLNVYIADLTGLDELYEIKVHMLHKERADKLKGFKMPADRVRSLGAGLLIEKGLEDFLNDQIVRAAKQKNMEMKSVAEIAAIPKDAEGRYRICYGYGPQGKPYFKDYPGIYFSLSHSGNMAVLAISDAEVGIDVQENRGYSEKIAKRFYHENEYKLLEQAESVSECEKLFYQIWTGKEAYIKYTGRGMGQDLRNFYVDLKKGRIISDAQTIVMYQSIPLDGSNDFCGIVFDKKSQKIDKIVKMQL